MTSAVANQTSGLRLNRAFQASARSASRAEAETHRGPWVVAVSDTDRQQRVLKALAEDFGGEVTSRALARHLSAGPGGAAPVLVSGLIAVLQGLQGLGAVTLEAQDETDFVIRLLPRGAEFYS